MYQEHQMERITGSLDADSVYPYPYPYFLEYLKNSFVINQFPI